jgi:hypothetical protein
MMPASIYSLDESTDPGYQSQVTQGIRLGARHYLRLFPVWQAFRGNNGTILSTAKALSVAGKIRRDPILLNLAQRQLQWVVGLNPFCQSLMYGEGHDFAPQYSAMSGDMSGMLPVGIQTKKNKDVPYWSTANCYNHKEVWVHPSARWLSLLDDLDGPAMVDGIGFPGLSARFVGQVGGLTVDPYPVNADGAFKTKLPAGQYDYISGSTTQSVTVLPGQTCQVDARKFVNYTMTSETVSPGVIKIRMQVHGSGPVDFAFRTENLELNSAPQTLDLGQDTTAAVEYSARVLQSRRPWVLVAYPGGNSQNRMELLGLPQ